jgi:hypothetical protein
MADYSTHEEGVGATGLIVAAVLIGLFVLVLALLGTGTIPASQATNPSAVFDGGAAAPVIENTSGTTTGN